MTNPAKSTRTAESLQAAGSAARGGEQTPPREALKGATRRAERAAITLLPRLAAWFGVAAVFTSLLAVILWWEAAQSGFLGMIPLGPLMLGLALGFGIGALLLRFLIAPNIERPALELASVAEAVAAGNLTVRVLDSDGGGHLPRLRRAVARMVTSLRRLAGAISGASHETAALAEQITASSDHMAMRAQEISRTSAATNRKAGEIADVVEEAAGSAQRLDAIASDLSSGARAGASRNRELRQLAATNRERLDAGSDALTRLEGEVHQTARAVQALAEASTEIRAFVTLVQKMARQSRLLSLNAAMEAARAGEHGDGFAVVATEVRRLATMSNEAAVRTEATVTAVLDRLDESRTMTERAVSTVDEVLGATRQAGESFEQVERAVEEADQLMSAVEEAAVATTELSGAISTQLAGASSGARQLARTMAEVTAAMEEQSAGTQEVAGAAGSLTRSAEHLAALVNTFQLDDGGTPQIHPPMDAAGADPEAAARGAVERREGYSTSASVVSTATQPARSTVLTSA